MTEPRRRLALAGIVAASILGQLVVLRGYLDNSVVNAISPTSVDTEDYWVRAQLLLDGRFADAFGDAYRMPGYAVVLAVADLLTPAPLLAVRLLQVLAVAATALCAEHVVRRVTTDGPVALLAAAVVAFYPPFWYLGPLLYAEALTVLGVGVLLVLCAGAGDRPRPGRLVVLGMVLALLVYLKPNNVVLLLPVGAFLLARVRPIKPAAVAIGTVVVVLGVLVAPWSLAVTASQDRVVLLSTNNGYTFYRGSGVWVPSEESLPRTVALRLGLADTERDAVIKARGFAMPRGAEADAYWRAEAVAAWRAEPWRTSAYAASKVAHSLGFSLGGIADVVLSVVTLAGIAAGVVLRRRRRHLAWVAFVAGAFFAMAVQVALYVPDVRFRVSLLDLPLLVLVALAVAGLRTRGRLAPSTSATTDRPAAAAR